MEITVANITSLRQELLNIWAKTHSNWTGWGAVIRQEHKVARLWRTIEKRYMGIGTSKVFGMADTLVTNNPKVSRKPKGYKQSGKAKADKTEPWGAGVLREAAIVSGSVPPFRGAAINLSAFGYADGVIRWNESWPALEPKKGEKNYKEKMERWERRASIFPFIIEFPYPARILLPHNERVPTMAIETATMFGWQIERLFPKFAFKVHEGSDLLEVIYYWDEERRGTIVEDTLVEDQTNIYGIVPYVQGFAGWGLERKALYGSKNHPGSMGTVPEDLAQGLLAPILDSIVVLDQWFSAMSHMVITIPGLLYATNQDALDIQRQMEDVEGVGVIGVAPADIKELPKSKLEPWMFEMGRILLADIDKGTYSAVVQGERAPGVETATAHALMLGSARQRFGHALEELNYMAGQLLGFAAKMVTVREEPIELDGVKCSGGDFDGNYRFYVDFMAEDEGAKLRQKASNQWEVERGGLDWETHHEEVGRANGTEIERRRLVQRMSENPQVLSAILGAAMETFRQKRAQEGIVLPPPAGGPPPGPPTQGGAVPPPPQPFVAQPGGPGEQAQVQRGMGQVPGEGMERAGM